MAQDLLDIPNNRSSHTVPTPRGGGLAIVIVLLLSGVVYPVSATGADRCTCLSPACYFGIFSIGVAG